MTIKDNFIQQNDFNILIVDDRKENLLALEELLSDEPCRIMKANSGQEALDILLQHEIFLILLDVQMPEMDGFETAELIRGYRKTKNIPIIFITAIGRDQEYIFKGYQCGAVDYLTKPIHPQILKQKIRIFFELYQQKRMLSEKNEELKRMFYITSHDLRSPLINIQGFSRFLSEYYEQEKKIIREADLPKELLAKLTPIQQTEIPNALDCIVSNVRIMDNLLKGLMHISRIGEVQINKQLLDVNRIISEIFESIQFQILERQIELKREDLPPCSGDSSLINQVFTNVINNAIKYNHRETGGFIRITGESKNHYIIYSIRDNGIGIPEHEQELIFNLFHRVNPKSHIEGEGIGLTAVKMIMERHHGKIWFESTPGEGTCFYLAFPHSTDE